MNKKYLIRKRIIIIPLTGAMLMPIPNVNFPEDSQGKEMTFVVETQASKNWQSRITILGFFFVGLVCIFGTRHCMMPTEGEMLTLALHGETKTLPESERAKVGLTLPGPSTTPSGGAAAAATASPAAGSTTGPTIPCSYYANEHALGIKPDAPSPGVNCVAGE